jgi:outer membrane cobalamin receptor
MSRRPLLQICLFAFAALLMSIAAAHADTLRGRVVDPDQRPVADAVVIVRRGPAVVTTVRTGADGRFGPVTLPTGTYEIVAGAPGLRSTAQTVRITPGAVADLTIALALTAIGESVVVSAAQVETPLSQVADAVTVVDRSTVDQLQITTAAEALRLVPGFHLVSSGGPGGLVSVFPRGGESDYTLVLVDGVPQNLFGGGFDGAHLSAGDLDRLEIVRGPQSALYGGGAIGGIVHAVTRLGGPLRANATVETGSHGTTSFTGAATGSQGPWDWRGAFDWLATDGDTRERASLGGRVANADYDRLAGSGGLAWSDGPSRRVRVDIRAGRNARGTPGPYGSDPMGFFGGLDLTSRGRNRFASVGASGVFRQSPTTAHRLHFSWATHRGHFISPFGASDDDTRRMTGRYQFDVDARVPISAGWELQHERADNTFVTGGTSQLIPISRALSGWFIEARPVVAARLFMNLGARLERIARRRLEGDAFGSRPTFDTDDVVWSTNPKVAVAWMARTMGTDTPGWLGWTKLRLGAGTGIKAPTTLEIAFTDNPSLKPERSRSLDLGIEQAVAQGTIVADATWFRNIYDDLIVSVPTALRDQGISRHRTDNVSNARAAGIELGVTWRPSSALAVRGGWTWLDTEVLGIDQAPSDAPLPYVVGDRLVRRPAQQGSMALTWAAPRTRVFLRINGRGTMLDLEPNLGAGACFGQPESCRAVFDNPGYVTTEAGAAVRVHATIELFGRVSNLFDRAYEEALGFPALGRSALIGLRVTGSR